MLGFHNREGGVDVFRFQLAQDLGMTVGELEERMDHAEYVAWSAYHKAKATMR